MTGHFTGPEPLVPEPLMTPRQVAALFYVDVKTVARWRKTGKLSHIRTPGGHCRYREAEIRAILNGIPQEVAH